MSAPQARDTAGVYRHIIDDVVTRVRTEFVQEGVDEAVLDELRELWEGKLLASGAIDQPAPPPAPQQAGFGPVPQYYQPLQGGPAATGYSAAQPAAATGAYLKQLGKPEKYLQPVGFHAGASSLPPGYPATSQAATYAPAAGAACGPAVASHPAATAAGNAAAAASAGYAAAVPASAGYAMQPAGAAVQQQQLQPQHMAQRPAAQLQQQYLPPPQQAARPQQQAAPQQCHQWQLQQQHQQQQQPQQQAQQTQQPGPTAPSTGVPADSRKRPYEGADQGGPQKQPFQPANGAAAAPAPAATIPQRDGNDDDAGPSQDTAGGGDDAFAGSDEGEDPLAGLSSDEDEEGAHLENVVLAQFEKPVSRTKTRTGTKWKCQLKNGIMHLNGRDVIFHKCTGEMQF